MDKKAFYELVDIETPDDFKFYDNIENLIESDEEWDIDILSPLLSEIPSDVIVELIDEYFNNLLDRLPDEETDLYTLIYNVSRTMKGRKLKKIFITMQKEGWRMSLRDSQIGFQKKI